MNEVEPLTLGDDPLLLADALHEMKAVCHREPVALGDEPSILGELAAVLDGPDYLELQHRVLGVGLRDYGALRLADDHRDFAQEARQEALDGAYYVACAMRRSSASAGRLRAAMAHFAEALRCLGE